MFYSPICYGTDNQINFFGTLQFFFLKRHSWKEDRSRTVAKAKKKKKVGVFVCVCVCAYASLCFIWGNHYFIKCIKEGKSNIPEKIKIMERNKWNLASQTPSNASSINFLFLQTEHLKSEEMKLSTHSSEAKISKINIANNLKGCLSMFCGK